MSVPFFDPTNVYYNTYSVPAGNFTIPYHFDVYQPDNSADFKCLSVICPSLEVGSTKWTVNGSWLTIGIYRDEGRTGYDETHYVFRLLPSFKLISYAQVLQYFIDSAPAKTAVHRQLLNVTTNQLKKLPSNKGRLSNYDVPFVPSERLHLSIRFNQAYDETGAPLKLQYSPEGEALDVNRVDSIYKNPREFFLSPQANELGDPSSAQDAVVDVYDYYGLAVNDATRAPYFATDIITRDTDVDPPRDNIKRRLQGTVEIQPGWLFDRYGNLVLGIQENNALVARSPILPLQLDTFGKPVKQPVQKATS